MRKAAARWHVGFAHDSHFTCVRRSGCFATLRTANEPRSNPWLRRCQEMRAHTAVPGRHIGLQPK